MLRSGQSVVEVIVAIAILVIIVSSAAVAVLGSFTSTRLAEEETQATSIAQEGLEAVQSIRNKDWDDLTNGTHGLTKSGDIWAFSGSSDVDSSTKFTRTITVSEVQRDGNGDIITSGGTIDSDTKKVVSAIAWDFTPTRNNTVDLITYITNWQTGRSVGGTSATCSTQANCLVIDSSAAALGGGNKRLEGITLENTDNTNIITIDMMTITWTGGTSGSKVTGINIDGGASKWSGSEDSGTLLDITNTDLATSTAGIPLTNIVFSKTMSGATFDILFTMSDASTEEVTGISP